MAWAAVAGAAIGVVGGAMSSKKSSGGTTTQTQDKSPWEYAQPWMISNLNEGQRLQDYYKQNPFNDQQKQAYSNLFGDLNQFRSQMAPSLYDRANGMMNSNYQRKSYDRPGLVGYSQGGGGLLQQPAAAQQMFSMPQNGNYGLLNFAQAAPQAQAAAQQAPAYDVNTLAQMVQDEIERQRKQKLADEFGNQGGTA